VRRLPAVTLGAIGLAAGAGLALLHDIHGAALLIGALIGLALLRIRRRPGGSTTGEAG
jgi:hypothetical protein